MEYNKIEVVDNINIELKKEKKGG